MNLTKIHDVLFTSNFHLEHIFSVAQQITELLSFVLTKWELVSTLFPSLHGTFPLLCLFSCMHPNNTWLLPSSHLSSSHPSRLWECFWESYPAWWCSTFSFVMIGANPSPPWNQARVSTPCFSFPLPFVTCWERPSCILVSVNSLFTLIWVG